MVQWFARRTSRGCSGTLRLCKPPVLKVTDNHRHSPTHQGYVRIPIHGGIELMVTCYLTPSLEAMIVSPDAIGHEFQCRGYTSVSNFDGVSCSLTLRHCRYVSRDARFPLLLVQGLLYTEPLLPPMTEPREPAPCQLRYGITDVNSRWPSRLSRLSILLPSTRQLSMYAKCPWIPALPCPS
jgi:hypothetical protein